MRRRGTHEGCILEAAVPARHKSAEQIVTDILASSPDLIPTNGAFLPPPASRPGSSDGRV